DAVNLTSRLEGMNKEYGTEILVSQTCYAATQGAGFLFRELDLIRVKGKLQPVTIYELVGREVELAADPSSGELRERLERFAQARTLYSHRHWEQAQHAFEKILEKWPNDGPSRTYWKRCQEYLFEEPPHAWDGVFTMTSK